MAVRAERDATTPDESLAAIVGTGNVDCSEATLAAFAGDLSFVRPVRPSCIARVESVEHVQQLVEYAVETATPLVPVSSGPPRFRGDTVPSVGGAIVVDLSGMKKVLHVDRRHRVAMFEPGVTFGELIPAVAREGLRLNMPLLPRRTKSVVASMLEREPVVMPKYHWDIGDPLACTEVVFGTGELFRTGAAAGSGTIEEQWAAGGAQKEAAGPSAASWYRVIQGAQGTMGIVTWASARCELAPVLEQPFFLCADRLERLFEPLHWLVRLRLVNECLVLNSVNLAAILGEGAEDRRRLAEELPCWTLFANVAAYDYFPEERIRGQVEDVEAIAQRAGLEVLEALGTASARAFLRLLQLPSSEPYWKLRPRGACHDVFFLSIYDELPALLEAMEGAATAAGYPPAEIGVYLQPVVQGVNVHCELNLFYDPGDPVESRRVEQLAATATKRLLDAGAFFSRPYGKETGLIIGRDAATVAALRKVKAIVDPHNIMNPGRLCF